MTLHSCISIHQVLNSTAYQYQKHKVGHIMCICAQEIKWYFLYKLFNKKMWKNGLVIICSFVRHSCIIYIMDDQIND